jgi:hypothetical protein
LYQGTSLDVPQNAALKLRLHRLLKKSLCRADVTSVAKAMVDFAALAARLKSRALSKQNHN